jgi:predicted phosphodiesterase
VDYREMVISDLHAPYHDPYAVELSCKAAEIVHPTRLIIAGDLIDCYQLSRFDKDPKRVIENLQVELDTASELLALYRSAVGNNCCVEFLPGNHEQRLYKYLCRNPELSSLRVLELPSLLGLAAHSITYHEQEFLPLPTLVVKHGDRVRKWSGYTARAELENERFSVSTVTGHTHRLGSHYITHRRGYVAGWENGCLCDVHPEYVHNPDWQQGFTIVSHSGRESFFAEQAIIVGDKKRKHTVVMGQDVRL